MRYVVSMVLAVSLVAAPSAAQTVAPHAPICAAGSTRSGTFESVRPWDDSTAFTGQSGHVVGQVSDVGDRPVTNAVLTLHPGVGDRQVLAQAQTDTAGRFAFPPVEPRAYFLRVTAIAYQQQWHELRVLSAAADSLCLRLRAVPIGLSPVRGSWTRE